MQNDNLQLTAITISAAFITAVNVTVVHHKVHSACVISRDSSRISNARLKTKMLVFLLHITKNNKSIIDKTIIQNTVKIIPVNIKLISCGSNIQVQKQSLKTFSASDSVHDFRAL